MTNNDANEVQNKSCSVHNLSYRYVCPECIKPFLKDTPFRDLKNVREYQVKKSSEIIEKDNRKDFNTIGLLKFRIVGSKSFGVADIIDLRLGKSLDTCYKVFCPKFTDYFSTLLFLNHTDIYLDLIGILKVKPDCYIINASGRMHPFFYGVACELGLKNDTSVFGYTKTLLFGKVDQDTAKEFPIVSYKEDHIGYAVPRINSNKSYYISVGNNISLNTALNLFLKLEPNFHDLLAQKLRKYILLETN